MQWQAIAIVPQSSPKLLQPRVYEYLAWWMHHISHTLKQRYSITKEERGMHGRKRRLSPVMTLIIHSCFPGRLHHCLLLFDANLTSFNNLFFSVASFAHWCKRGFADWNLPWPTEPEVRGNVRAARWPKHLTAGGPSHLAYLPGMAGGKIIVSDTASAATAAPRTSPIFLSAPPLGKVNTEEMPCLAIIVAYHPAAQHLAWVNITIIVAPPLRYL